MSEEILRTVKNMLASGKGDTKRLREIMNTIKEGEPVLMSDYKYIESLASQNADPQPQERVDIPRPPTSQIRDESLEILRIRLAEGHITIDEFRELKKALTDE
ncbi:MAG: hypothetical protein ACREA3_04920 [Nitrosotalea sp.]